MAPDYITINGRVFARNNRLATQTLFITVNGSTASGTFKATKDSIYLHDMQGERVAFINAHGEKVNYAFYVVGTGKAMKAAMDGQKELLDQARAALAKARGNE